MFILSLIVVLDWWSPVCLCVRARACAHKLADMDFVIEVIGPLWWNIDSGCIFPHQNIVFDTVCRIWREACCSVQADAEDKQQWHKRLAVANVMNIWSTYICKKKFSVNPLKFVYLHKFRKSSQDVVHTVNQSLKTTKTSSYVYPYLSACGLSGHSDIHWNFTVHF